MGFRVFLYDFDTIEEHNLGGQLFRQVDIGLKKTTAIARIVEDFCGDFITTFEEPVTKFTPHHYFAFSAFDNMKARADLFVVWKNSIPVAPQGIVPIFIDGRLEMETFQIFCVTPDKIQEYEASLFSDTDVEDAPCTMKQSSHTAAMIGSLMSAFFTNHIANIYSEETIREVPFFYEYIVPMNYTLTH
jgi:molybdopterin/thiamine biosynthesis adenylyltransferase